MSVALKLGLNEVVNEVKRKARTYDTSAEAQNVRVVVKTCKTRGEGVRAASRADSAVLVCRHRHTDARSADENAEGRFALLYLFAKLVRVDGEVAAIGRVRSNVYHLVALCLKMLFNKVLEFYSAVVGANYYLFAHKSVSKS